MKNFLFYLIFTVFVLSSCKQKINAPSREILTDLDIKKGSLIVCGPADMQYGNAVFETSCDAATSTDFNTGFKLLHSFEYDEAEKSFAKVVDKNPACAMAYWGIAMSNFHPLWTPPTEPELIKGEKAIKIARSLSSTQRESDYIESLAGFFENWKQKDHRSRTLLFEKGMESLYAKYPGDKEAAVLYALSLDAAADPTDLNYSKQKKAGSILESLYPGNPDHPGIVHYLIHTYDAPPMAEKGLAAARKYASVAPSSAHALHMPSHIFTRLGYWDESIQSNLQSVSSAKCYAEAAGMAGHWDEELHGLDYLVYAYLQKGQNDSAKKLVDYLNSMQSVSPVNFKVAYALASIPSRYLLENKNWSQAAKLQLSPTWIKWEEYPWQKAIVHFTRAVGAAQSGQILAAKKDHEQLKALNKRLQELKDNYKANQVAIQVKAAEAWINLAEGKNDVAIKLMQEAADMEDKTEKHPVTPCEVWPARHQLGDMYLKMKNNSAALTAYETELKKHPNRLNALYAAATTAEASGDKEKASKMYETLLAVADQKGSRQTEIKKSKAFLGQ
jgi:tetratricopeptide (TPR) repeat protein